MEKVSKLSPTLAADQPSPSLEIVPGSTSSQEALSNAVDERLRVLKIRYERTRREIMCETCLQVPLNLKVDDAWNSPFRSALVKVPFQKVLRTTDDLRHKSVFAVNRSSRILQAIAIAKFKKARMLNSVQHLFVKHFGSELYEAEKSRNIRDIATCERIADMFSKDGPWGEEEWLIASKTMRAPIHVHYRCQRVPINPHIVRYAYSVQIENVAPIRIVVETKEYVSKQ